MAKGNLTHEQRKSKILSYLDKNPLSTIRDISDNYQTSKSNFRVVRKTVSELFEQDKIGRIFDSREYYFVNPLNDDGKEILVNIMNSKKVFERRFTIIKYDDDIHFDRPIFPQIVEKCINLFHLRFKIVILEERRKSKENLTSKKISNLAKKFQSNFIEFLKDYTREKYSIAGNFIAERGTKAFVESKHPTQENMLVYLSNYMDARYENDKLYFEQLTSGKIPLKDKLNLMSTWIRTGNKRNAADEQGTTNKNVQRILHSIMYDKGEYSLEKAAALQQVEKGREIVPDVSSFDTSKVFWELAVASVAPLLKTAAGRRKISKESKKFFGFDLLKVVDWKSFDTS